MILGQRIRLYLNDVQSTFFERCAGTARFAFNWGLARWQARYDAGEKPSWVKLNGELNAVKAVEFPWMAELPWAVTNKALADLGTAFTHFFRRVKAGGPEPGYPRFKSKKRTTPAFAIEGRALQFDGKRVKIPKLGWVRTRQEVRLPGKILSTRFTKSAGHWYVSIQTEVAESWIYPHRCETQAAVGVDLGVRDLAVLSTALSTGSSPEHTTVERTNSRRKPGERDGNGLLARRMAFWHSWLCVQVTSLWTRPTRWYRIAAMILLQTLLQPMPRPRPCCETQCARCMFWMPTEPRRREPWRRSRISKASAWSFGAPSIR